MYPASTFEHLSGLNVFEALERTARRLPNKVALVDGERRLTYAEIVERSGRLAEGLRKSGLQKGDVAGVYLRNSAEQVVVFYALQRLGAVVAWINPLYREHEARFILENSGAKAAFVTDEWQGFRYVDALQPLRSELPGLETLFVVSEEPLSAPPPGVTDLRDVERLGSSSPASFQPVQLDDLSMLIYTSGTTARPKGAMISQEQVVRAGWSYSLGVDATEEDVFIAFLPMSHSYGCGSLLVQPLLLGATLVLLDKFSPERAFQLIQAERATLQLAAPAHYIMELESPVRSRYDLSSLRAGLIAGQIAPKGLITRVDAEMGIYISSFLGSSEVGPGLAIILPYGTPLATREKYIGFPLPGTEVKIVDPATEEEKPAAEAGELLLKGWHVTRGYWRNPTETDHQIRNGWLHTGDLAARDADGCVQILGRIKECINRGGFKVIPSEIERLLLEVDGVEEVCVVGTPNRVLGESICACVRLRPGLTGLSLAEVRAALAGRVADHKLPDELLIVSEFPRMPGGLKVNRFGAGGVMELANESPEKQVWHGKR
jgi:fatty-acyl-CoA synthase